jgi:hypothetical protein
MFIVKQFIDVVRRDVNCKCWETYQIDDVISSPLYHSQVLDLLKLNNATYFEPERCYISSISERYIAGKGKVVDFCQKDYDNGIILKEFKSKLFFVYLLDTILTRENAIGRL